MRTKSSTPSIVIALLFFAAVSMSVLTGALPWVVIVAYIAFSFVTFIAYALDKSAAKKGSWRTSEQSLHILSLAGGWPGALVAQQMLRHKSRKVSFRVEFWITVVVNIAVLIWLHTEGGRAALYPLLRSLLGN